MEEKTRAIIAGLKEKQYKSLEYSCLIDYCSGLSTVGKKVKGSHRIAYA